MIRIPGLCAVLLRPNCAAIAYGRCKFQLAGLRCRPCHFLQITHESRRGRTRRELQHLHNAVPDESFRPEHQVVAHRAWRWSYGPSTCSAVLES